MPEATQDVTVYTYISLEDFKEIYHMAEGTSRKFSFGTVTVNKGQIEIEAEHEVTVEFDFADYAPDYDGWRD